LVVVAARPDGIMKNESSVFKLWFITPSDVSCSAMFVLEAVSA
jgi:hypothetical protein